MIVQRRVVLGRISYGVGNYDMDALTLPDGEVAWTMLSENYNAGG